jgi:septal ring factor EnvC (AmiA/AmiB activator)
MSKKGLGPGGVFQIACAVIAVIAIAIDRLVEGQVSTPFLWCLFSIYGTLILVGFQERLSTLLENIEENNKQVEKLQKEFKDLQKSLGEVERQVRYMDTQ